MGRAGSSLLLPLRGGASGPKLPAPYPLRGRASRSSAATPQKSQRLDSTESRCGPVVLVASTFVKEWNALLMRPGAFCCSARPASSNATSAVATAAPRPSVRRRAGEIEMR